MRFRIDCVAIAAIYCHWCYVLGNSNKEHPMANTLNLSLTDELRAFVDANSGNGTLYATPSEYVRDLLRQQKVRQEAHAAREAILDGYQDAVAGRTHEFKGDLDSLLKKVR